MSDERFPYTIDGEDPSKADVFAALLHGKVLTTQLKTKRGTFTMKYPDENDRARIMVMIADAKLGRSDDVIDYRDKADIIGFATLNVTVIDGPEWWKTMGRWERCPDHALIRDLLERGRLFRRQVDEDVERSPFGADVGGPPGAGAVAPMGGGAFSGLANGPAASKHK